jgi:hypothetical protein
MRGRGALLVAGVLSSLLVVGDAGSAPPAPAAAVTACEGHRAALPATLLYELESGAFPGSGRPDVAVHVPPGFDATRRPGLVVYFHGWNGCVEASTGDADMPCQEGGDPQPASHLAAQLDDARVNAVLVAIELRAGMPTGEPGALASPGGLRALLRELFDAHLDLALGESAPCPLEVDSLDRVLIVAHSGGYQAAASVLARGDVPAITEVVLLDALYGADEVFASWVRGAVARFDASRRFVDLYTCCGGTLERSRALAALASGPLVLDDDGDAEVDPASLELPVVFKRVPRAHGELPSAYVGAIFRAAGFAAIR